MVDKNDRIDLLSKDLEFVKDAVQATTAAVVQTNAILERNTVTLEDHVRRTAIAEQRLDQVDIVTKDLNTRMQPLEIAAIKKTGARELAKSIGKFLTYLSGAATAIYTILHALSLVP